MEKTSSGYEKLSIPSQFTTNCWTHPWPSITFGVPEHPEKKQSTAMAGQPSRGCIRSCRSILLLFPCLTVGCKSDTFITLALICADESPTQSDQHILLATWILWTGDTITMSLMMVRHCPHHHCLHHHLRPQHQYGKSLYLSHSCHDDVGLNPLEALKVSGNFLPFPIDSLMNKC